MNLRSSLSIVGAFTVAVALVGCEDRTQTTQEHPTSAPLSPEAPPPAAAPSVDNPAGIPAPHQPPAPTADATKLDDGQVAAVVVALNTGEIQEAKLAVANATSAEVKGLASDMAGDHQAMLDKASKDAAKGKIAPLESPVSDKLRTQVAQELSTLQGLSGPSFDTTYVDDQVKGHQGALALIDQMTPNVQDQQLRTDLEQARDKVDAHLRHALKVQRALAPGNTSMQAR